MASTIIGLVIELRLDKCRGARRAGAKFTTLVQIRQKKTEPALTALSMAEANEQLNNDQYYHLLGMDQTETRQIAPFSLPDT